MKTFLLSTLASLALLTSVSAGAEALSNDELKKRVAAERNDRTGTE